jgi:hypothetical protein
MWTAERQREYAREWTRRKHASDPEFRRKRSESSRKWQKANPLQHALAMYPRSARKRGIEYTLSDQELEKLVLAECQYCGAEPAPVNGVDRVDNNTGYVSGNCATACSDCNYAKRKMSVDQFKRWIAKAARHMRL